MQIDIIAVGKIKEKYIQKGLQEYLKRLGPYARIKIIEVNDEKIPANASLAEEEGIRQREGDKILAKVKPDSFIVTLEIDGELLTSGAFAQKVEELMVSGKSHLTFIIGGSIGLSDDIKRRADLKISFGRFTYPHQLMRLILMEQIYRCYRIIRKEPYHK
ncbi:MAG: 23S rRNA (pseudouridine(1915)-N(3))-methyltransferase RlmH [Clostridia bacterium]|jgi:23S rRNA (pseudouridine1915-N3)-methyltransferase|nr:23S rRNA (pseudouridine(1915)-N(3))-methyltransferase RlmH [Clostridia bacterium]